MKNTRCNTVWSLCFPRKSLLPPTLPWSGGCEAVSVITNAVPGELVDLWHSYGVRVISTRTVGYEHVDYRRAAELGIVVSNVSYTPHTVAEYTVMAILMAIPPHENNSDPLYGAGLFS